MLSIYQQRGRSISEEGFNFAARVPRGSCLISCDGNRAICHHSRREVDRSRDRHSEGKKIGHDERVVVGWRDVREKRVNAPGMRRRCRGNVRLEAVTWLAHIHIFLLYKLAREGLPSWREVNAYYRVPLFSSLAPIADGRLAIISSCQFFSADSEYRDGK